MSDELERWLREQEALDSDAARRRAELERDAVWKYARYLERAVREEGPDAELGRRVRAGGRAGTGRVSRIPTDELNARLRELHDEYPDLSWTRACDEVGGDVGLSGRCVRARKGILRW